MVSQLTHQLCALSLEPIYHYYRMFTTAGSKPLTTAGFGSSAVKVIGDKNDHHHYHCRFMLLVGGD